MADVLEKKEEAKDLLVDKQPKEPLFSKKNRKFFLIKKKFLKSPYFFDLS